jgi:conjugal transfer pilin signal peptidase TrbI
MSVRKPMAWRRLAQLWYACAAVAALWLIASSWFGVYVNVTRSLPGTLYFVDKRATLPTRGDTVALSWGGGYGYQRGAVLLKKVYGLPGDTIEHDARLVKVSGQPVATALETSARGTRLQIVAPGVVPEQHVFVATPTVDGFDSRYAIFGTQATQHILGKAYELF